MSRVKNLNKTKTIICANLYDSMNYTSNYSKLKFIDSCLQLAEEFPDTFKIIESSFVHVVIKTVNLSHCFDLYKHNEEKVIATVK
jgi:hypothetical protein